MYAPTHAHRQVLNFQSMCIMADLGDETTVAGSNEKVLCVLRAHHDGSFDMTPGFSTPAQRYRFEDDHGECAGLVSSGGEMEGRQQTPECVPKGVQQQRIRIQTPNTALQAAPQLAFMHSNYAQR